MCDGLELYKTYKVSVACSCAQFLGYALRMIPAYPPSSEPVSAGPSANRKRIPDASPLASPPPMHREPSERTSQPVTHTKSPQTKQPDQPPIPAIITSYTPSRHLRELFKSKFATFGSGLVQTASGLVSSRTPSPGLSWPLPWPLPWSTPLASLLPSLLASSSLVELSWSSA